MADSLIDRIGYRLKFVRGVDRRLLLEARDALGSVEPREGLSAGEVHRWLVDNDIKLMTWQEKRLQEMGG